jgi:hypothetical protein
LNWISVAALTCPETPRSAAGVSGLLDPNSQLGMSIFDFTKALESLKSKTGHR